MGNGYGSLRATAVGVVDWWTPRRHARPYVRFRQAQSTACQLSDRRLTPLTFVSRHFRMQMYDTDCNYAVPQPPTVQLKNRPSIRASSARIHQSSMFALFVNKNNIVAFFETRSHILTTLNAYNIFTSRNILLFNLNYVLSKSSYA
uniref:Uncharacterized protein n=1 Tax=Plectus sambesii TaxID=2011161 RepID=A0A914W646_9BILA